MTETMMISLPLSSIDGGFVDLSPQSRMKLRMHEKAKKKSAEKYTVHQLLEKVNKTECLDKTK